jgi:Family of unknown function (DUF6527)
MRHNHLEHRFVQYIPERLDSGVLYISMEYATAAHRCCCGCGEEVVTPFSPTDWSMTFDGEAVSLSPSIGNWNFACRSHYFIRRGRVLEAGAWTDNQVEGNRRMDRSAKARYYDVPNLTKPTLSNLDNIPEAEARDLVGIRKRIVRRWNRLAKKVTAWRRHS